MISSFQLLLVFTLVIFVWYEIQKVQIFFSQHCLFTFQFSLPACAAFDLPRRLDLGRHTLLELFFSRLLKTYAKLGVATSGSCETSGNNHFWWWSEWSDIKDRRKVSEVQVISSSLKLLIHFISKAANLNLRLNIKEALERQRCYVFFETSEPKSAFWF